MVSTLFDFLKDLSSYAFLSLVGLFSFSVPMTFRKNKRGKRKKKKADLHFFYSISGPNIGFMCGWMGPITELQTPSLLLVSLVEP